MNGLNPVGIFCANQLTSFYMRATLALNDLNNQNVNEVWSETLHCIA